MRLSAILLGNGLLRVANSASGLLIGFYLAFLSGQGQPFEAGLVGALAVVSNVAELGGSVPFGALADRLTSRILLAAAAIMGGVATLLFGLSGMVAIFYLSRSIEGLAAAAVTPALLTHLTDVTRHDAAFRNRTMSWFELSLLAGLALGGALGGVLWESVGAVGFGALSIVYLAVAALFWWGAQDAGIQRQNRFDRSANTPLYSLRMAVDEPIVRQLAPSWVAVNGVVGLWLTHIAFQLTRPQVAGQWLVGRFEAAQVGALSLAYAIIFGLGIMFWSWGIGRIGRLRTMRWAIAGMFGVSGCFFLLNRSGEWQPNWRWAVVAVYVVLIMVQAGFTPAALAFLASSADKSAAKGTTMGIYTLLLGLGNALGAALGGALAENYYLDGLLAGTLILGVIAWLGLRRLANPGEAPN